MSEPHDEANPCAVCRETPTRRYGLLVDGEPLTLQVPLCQQHGDRYVFSAGMVLGEMLRVWSIGS